MKISPLKLTLFALFFMGSLSLIGCPGGISGIPSGGSGGAASNEEGLDSISDDIADDEIDLGAIDELPLDTVSGEGQERPPITATPTPGPGPDRRPSAPEPLPAADGEYDDSYDDPDSDDGNEYEEEVCTTIEEVQGKPVKIEIPCELMEERQVLPTQGQFHQP